MIEVAALVALYILIGRGLAKVTAPLDARRARARFPASRWISSTREWEAQMSFRQRQGFARWVWPVRFLVVEPIGWLVDRRDRHMGSEWERLDPVAQERRLKERDERIAELEAEPGRAG